MSGPPHLVLIAGWAHGERSLAPLAEAIASGCLERGRSIASTSPSAETTAALCLPGSKPNRPAFTSGVVPSDYAAALASRLERGGRPAVLIGWSMGGMIALETAIHFPAVVHALVLIGSCARFWPPGTVDADSPAGPIVEMIAGLRRDRGQTLRDFFSLVHSNECPEERLEAEARQAADQDLDRLVHGLEYIAAFDVRARLHEICQPTLIVHGRNDRVIWWKASQLLGAAIQESTLSLVRDADHGLPATAPQRVAPLIQDFLEARVPGA